MGGGGGGGGTTKTEQSLFTEGFNSDMIYGGDIISGSIVLGQNIHRYTGRQLDLKVKLKPQAITAGLAGRSSLKARLLYCVALS